MFETGEIRDLVFVMESLVGWLIVLIQWRNGEELEGDMISKFYSLDRLLHFRVRVEEVLIGYYVASICRLKISPSIHYAHTISPMSLLQSQYNQEL